MRTNPFEERENDEIQQASKDSIFGHAKTCTNRSLGDQQQYVRLAIQELSRQENMIIKIEDQEPFIEGLDSRTSLSQ